MFSDTTFSVNLCIDFDSIDGIPGIAIMVLDLGLQRFVAMRDLLMML